MRTYGCAEAGGGGPRIHVARCPLGKLRWESADSPSVDTDHISSLDLNFTFDSALGNAPVSESVSLPVVSCPTAFGVTPPSTLAPLPASEEVDVPASLARDLAVYSDTRGFMNLLGPRGWACSAMYGADGSGGVIVYPSGEAVPQSWGAGWPLSSTSTDEAISGTQTAGSPVQAAGQACPLFAVAATTYENDLGRACHSRPSSESVQQISAGVVGFEDPPGLQGDGIPSGGQEPADGMATYSPSLPSYLATCTLPSNEHALCTAVLNDVIALYGKE